MKLSIIDYLNALNENRIKEGFRFVYNNDVFQIVKEKDKLIARRQVNGPNFCYLYVTDDNLDKEIEILTPELIESEKPKITGDNIFFGIDFVEDTSKKTMLTQQEIDKIIKKSVIKTEKSGDKTTIVTVILPNGFVLVESSSCVDPKNFDMKVGKEICMKKITDKIWELEGYKLQSELKGDE